MRLTDGRKEKEMTKEMMIEKIRKLNKSTHENMEQKKKALNIMVNAVQVGGKILALIPVEDLKIDESYQRPLQSHVLAIANEWKDVKCDPLVVNYRGDGYFYVVDGQHRRKAAIIKGIEHLVCVILVGLTVKKEAELFGSQGNGVKKPNPYDIFKANVRSGEKIDCAIKKACDRYGVEVKKSSNPKNLSCITIVRKIFRKGDEEDFYWIMELLDELRWDNMRKGYCHAVINALYEIKKKYNVESDFIRQQLLCALKTTSPDELFTLSKAKYPQYLDMSKALKMLLLDIIGDSKTLIIIREQLNTGIA